MYMITSWMVKFVSWVLSKILVTGAKKVYTGKNYLSSFHLADSVMSKQRRESSARQALRVPCLISISRKVFWRCFCYSWRASVHRQQEHFYFIMMHLLSVNSVYQSPDAISSIPKYFLSLFTPEHFALLSYPKLQRCFAHPKLSSKIKE